MTEKKEEVYRNNNICRFCEKNESVKVRYQCHLTGNYRSPAHSNCNINVTQKQSNFIPLIFHSSSNYDCHLFFKKLFHKENDKVKIDFITRNK